jgi:ABC-type antimicrobial peptide transport system permease subunit
VLSAVGLYATLSYLVVQRTMELGLRMALGAQRENVLALIVHRGVSLTVAGLAIGFCLAICLARLLSSFLFEVDLFDPASIFIPMIVILGVALIASSVPALRAAHLDPIETLRQQ